MDRLLNELPVHIVSRPVVVAQNKLYAVRESDQHSSVRNRPTAPVIACTSSTGPAAEG